MCDVGRSPEIREGSSEGLGRLARDSIHPSTVASRATFGAEPARVPMDRGVCGKRPEARVQRQRRWGGWIPRATPPDVGSSAVEHGCGGPEGSLPVAEVQTLERVRLRSHLSLAQ